MCDQENQLTFPKPQMSAGVKGGLAVAAAKPQGLRMSDEDRAASRRSKMIIALSGIGALLAWFALLWFMFGEVL
jgi:hypothetical protein